MNKPESARLRMAVVGAGQASAPHLQSLQDLDGELELARVVIRRADKLPQLRLPAGALASTRIEDILEDATIRAVLVLTPPDTHLDIVERLARAGKHVLVEKPLDISLDKAQQLVEICEQHDVKLAVMLQHRMRDASIALQGLVKDGSLGPLLSASASIRWWRPQSYYDEPGRGTMARDGGGVLMTQAIHTLDLMLSLTGMPDRLIAMAATSSAHRMECEDTVAAVLHFPNGAIGNIDATTAAYPGFPERIALNFEHGSATLEAGELHAEMLDGRIFRAGEKQATGSGANPMAFDHAFHRAVIQDFAAAVRGNSEPAVTGRSALRAQRLIAAIMEASNRGVAVSIAP